MVNLALDGTGFCPVKSYKTFEAELTQENTFSKLITRLTDADVKNKLFDSNFSHGVLFFDFSCHCWFVDIKLKLTNNYNKNEFLYLFRKFKNINEESMTRKLISFTKNVEK